MAIIKINGQLIDILRSSGLEWLLPNLRQDALVWDFLCEPTSLEKFCLSKPNGVGFIPEDFSPARLALVALGQTSFPSGQIGLFDAIEGQIIQSAIRISADQDLLSSYPQDLAAAGRIGLVLAYRQRITNSWRELLDLIPENDCRMWSTPMACLWGWTEEPAGLIKALIQPGACPLRYQLAIHTVLSNPLYQKDQTETILGSCEGTYGDLLPGRDRLLLAEELNNQSPQIAADFCSRWLEIHPGFTEGIDNLSKAKLDFNQLEEILFEKQARELCGKTENLDELIKSENRLVDNIYGDLIHLSLSNKSSRFTQRGTENIFSGSHEPGIQIAGYCLLIVQEPAKQAEIALTFANLNLPDEACKLLPQHNDALPDDPAILYTIAKTALLAGDAQRAGEAASHISGYLDMEAVNNRVPVTGNDFSYLALGEVLMDLHKPEAAAQVFELALQACPSDPKLLKMLAESYRPAQQIKQAADTFNLLVLLHPDDIEFHRAYAQCLAELGEWETCLTERSVIIESGENHAAVLTPDDIYNYAYCALKAKHPELTLRVCLDNLEKDGNDTESLVYAGQAYLAMDQKEKGLEYLIKATQCPTQVPQAWLALAEAQQQISNIQTVIETLKNAAQAMPNSAEIQLALGEEYLKDNTPSLALPTLQLAAELSPDTPRILSSLGQALKSLGHNQQARQVLAQAYKLDPRFPDLAQTYADLLIALNEPEEAIDPLELLINSKVRQAPAVYLEYARCVLNLHKQGSTTNPPMKALVALNELLQIDPQHAEAKALTAEALAASGENELAFQAYRDALETTLMKDKSWFERLSFGFGSIASRLGKHDIAIAALQEASHANPDNPAPLMALSDAYLAADLPEDAIQSARVVLVIEGENPDRLAWFARQITKLLKTEPHHSPSSILSLVKQMAPEALNALNKAIQLAPTRTDLLIQLGDLESNLGAENDAHMLFKSIAGLDFASIDDLVYAARYLSQIEDHDAAIASLEKAIAKDQQVSSLPTLTLYTLLASEYVNNHDHPSAINTLDKAIVLMPDNNEVISLKVEILLGLGQAIEALSCIEAYLQSHADSDLTAELLFLASQISRCTGNLPAAINYARSGERATHQQGNSDGRGKVSAQNLTQLAEIYRTLLQAEQAYQIIQKIDPEADEFTNEQGYIEYLCLQAELALEMGRQNRPEIQDVDLDPANPSYPRLLAIRARLMNNDGKSQQAEELLHIAISKATNVEAPDGMASWSDPYTRYISQVSIAEAAMETGLWDQAFSCIQHGLESNREEPLPHLLLSKAIILKAEFANLCETFEVSRHKPQIDAAAYDGVDACIQSLDKAQSIVQMYWDEQIIADIQLTNDQISRWRSRANIVFGEDDDQNFESGEILTQQARPEDAPALISYLHRVAVIDTDSDAMSRIIKVARAYPSDPNVVLQAALALQDSNPASAMKSLQSAIEQNQFLMTPSLAFCNVLLANTAVSQEEYTVARLAIEKSISYWENEPAWHALAAQICIHQFDSRNAIQHYLEATRLAPTNPGYQNELGKMYMKDAVDDAHLLIQAAAAFEQAIAINGEDVEALVNLATTQYQLRDLEHANMNARNALALSANRADIYQLLSEIAVGNQEYQAAYDYANKAILTGPKDIRSTIVLVRSLAALGKYHEAVAKLNTAISTESEGKQLYFERVDIIRRMDGPRAALHELVTLSKTYPDDFQILNALAKSFLEVGDVEQAVASAYQALKASSERTSHNEQANLHLLIGQLLRQSGQLDKSIDHLSEAIQLAPDRLEPYLELGLARKERREYQQALQIFEQATMIAPDDPRALYQAGLAFKESKDYKSSETMLRRAVNLAPNDLTIRRQLAAVVALNLVHNPRIGRS